MAQVAPRQRLQPGDSIRVEEPDYMYGMGPLLLRVTRIGGVERMSDGDWLHIDGLAHARRQADGTQARVD
jgi:hypothetical protein